MLRLQNLASTIATDVENALIQIVVKQFMAKLVSMSAFFALSFVNPVVSIIVTKIVTYLVQETALGLSLLWITLNISYAVGSVESATAALKNMMENPKDYNATQQAALEKNFDDSAVKLIRLGISGLH